MEKVLKSRKSKGNRRTQLAIVIILAAIVLNVASIGGVVAYLTSTDAAMNDFTVGEVQVTPVEEFNPPAEMTPGVSFEKNVRAKNLGPCDAYIRVNPVFTDGFMKEHSTVDWNLTDWVYNESDGYYYYKTPIGVDKETTSLMTTVTVSDEIDLLDIKSFDILIYVEAVQSEGAETYKEAWADIEKNQP